jgi:hypothetical protein
MAQSEYKACCLSAAPDPESAFCPECGGSLSRCACGNLMDSAGLCAACVNPHLYLEKGAVLESAVGERLSVPFILRNDSQSRALSIQNVFHDGKHVPLTWERLEAGRERAFSLETESFTEAGIHNLNLTVVVVSRFDEAEELYAFSSQIPIHVESVDKSSPNISISGVSGPVGHGITINSVARQGESGFRSRRETALLSRRAVPLERAERYELQNGIRGYKALGARIPRDVEFDYDGFPAEDTPLKGPLSKPVLRCGRNSRRYDAKLNPQPNDLCLRIYDRQSGKLDAEASKGISRRLCDFVIQNDRLHLRAISDKGLAHNGEIQPAGATVIVSDGDSLTTPVRPGQTLTFMVKFKVSSGSVRQIRIVQRTVQGLDTRPQQGPALETAKGPTPGKI